MSTNLSSRIRDFIKAEAVLVIAAVAAVASMAVFPLTPPRFPPILAISTCAP